MPILDDAELWDKDTRIEPWMKTLIKVSPLPSNFESVKNDPDWWRLVRFLAELNYSTENVDYLDRIDEWKQQGRDEAKAIEIYEGFVSDRGSQVNITSQNANELKAIFEPKPGVEAEDQYPEMFDDSYTTIFKLIAANFQKDYSTTIHNYRDILLLADMPDAPVEISAPEKGNKFTRDQVDMSIVDNFNTAALKDLKEGFSTNFWQVGDLVVIDAGMGVDQPYVKWMREQPGCTQGATVTMTAKGGAFSSGTVTVAKAADRDLVKKAIARVSKKKVVFE